MKVRPVSDLTGRRIRLPRRLYGTGSHDHQPKGFKMKTAISLIFMTIVAVSLVVAAFLFVKNFVMTGVQEVGEWLEERKSIHRVVVGAKRLSSHNLHNLAVEIRLWDTRRYLEWLETKSILANPRKQQEIDRCQQMLSEEWALAVTLLDGMSDEEIVEIVKNQAKVRAPGWRRELLTRLERDSRRRI
ncbi:hypothetical protein ACFL2Q_06110 [Thermodesulfobacteriota bacterium]